MVRGEWAVGFGRAMSRPLTSSLASSIALRRVSSAPGWVVKEAIEGYLALDEERDRQTLAALAEVDAGATIDHAEIQAWAKRPYCRSTESTAVILWRSAGSNLPTRTCIDCTTSWSPSIPARQLVPYVCFSVASGAFPAQPRLGERFPRFGSRKSGAYSPRSMRFVTR